MTGMKYYLDKGWRFLLGDGVEEAKTTQADSYSSSKAGGERGIPSVAYDDSDWRVLDLPHDYLTEMEFKPENLISHGYKTRCNAWYRKTFCLPKEAEGKHLLLSFEGIAVTSRVYLNGSLIGRSFSAYAPLDIDISDRAFFGDAVNTLAVFVDGLTTEGWWYEGAGIYRHVILYVKEPLHIAHDSAFAKPVKLSDLEWAVECEATAENTAYTDNGCSLKTELYDGETLVAAGSSGTAVCPGAETCRLAHRLTVTAPELWDVDHPKLYRVRFILFSADGTALDETSARIGFRTFTVDNEKGFFLNGTPIKLKGTCNHQDHAGVGVAVPDAIQHYRIRRLKEMGTNAYRCSHNMPTKAVLDACDELGILVMDENRRFESRPEVLAHVAAMVKRDRNHPCVVLYSLFNEEPIQGTKEGGNIFRRMKHTVLSLDDSRMVTGAMNGGYNDPEGAAKDMDVTGINYAVPDGVLEYRRLYPDHPVFGSENNSALSTRGCYISDRDTHVLSCYDEERAGWGQTIKTTWKFAREHDWFGGIFIWTGFDYRGEPTPFQWPSIGSYFGIMDTCGFPKDSFYQNRACFVDEPMVHVLPHWNHAIGETVRVMTASNCEETEIFVNGKSFGKKPSDCVAPAEWSVPFESGTLSAVGYRKGIAVAWDEKKTAGVPVSIVIEPDRAELISDGMDAMPINFSVRDKDGNPVETADNLLTFSLTGAVMLGVGNGSPICLESDHKPQRSLYAGHCQMIVGSVVGSRSFTIRCEGENLVPAEITVPCRTCTVPDYIGITTKRTLTGFTVSEATYATEPNACMTIADNDNNSFAPMTVDSTLRPGHTEGWKILRAFFLTPKAADAKVAIPCTLLFSHVEADTVRIFVNGSEINTTRHPEGVLTAEFSGEPGVRNDLRVSLRADGKPAGISGSIELQC